jgi:hypothetical protein
MLTGIKENAKFQKSKNGEHNEPTSGLKHLVDGVKKHHNVKYGPISLTYFFIQQFSENDCLISCAAN